MSNERKKEKDPEVSEREVRLFIEGKTLTYPTVGAERWTEVFLLDRPADARDKWVHVSFLAVAGGLNQSSD